MRQNKHSTASEDDDYFDEDANMRQIQKMKPSRLRSFCAQRTGWLDGRESLVLVLRRKGSKFHWRGTEKGRKERAQIRR